MVSLQCNELLRRCHSPVDEHVFDFERLGADGALPLRRLLVHLEPRHGIEACNVVAVHRPDRRVDAGVRELPGSDGGSVLRCTAMRKVRTHGILERQTERARFDIGVFVQFDDCGAGGIELLREGSSARCNLDSLDWMTSSLGLNLPALTRFTIVSIGVYSTRYATM